MRNLILTFCLSFMVSLAFSQIHVVSPNGDVGVGTTTPSTKLDVNGSVHIRGNHNVFGSGVGSGWAGISIGKDRTATGYSYLDLYSMNGTDIGTRLTSNEWGTSILAHKGTNRLIIRTEQPNAPIWFRTAGDAANRLVIAPNGKVGIGVDSPGYMLQVGGWAGKPGGGDWAVASDRNLKKNITEFDMGLAEIIKLNPIYFQYNGKAGIEDTKTTYVGLIAQDFQKIAPDAVRKLSHTEMIHEEDKSYSTGKTTDYLSMDASSIRYMLVNAVKEQQQLIDKQNNTIKQQSSTIEALEVKLTDLSKIVEELQSKTLKINSTIEGSGKAYIEQNKPNPLKDYTRIEYFIPTDAGKAFLTVQNMAGQEIKRIDIIENGKGFVELKLKDMAAGIYTYRLKVDGHTIDTKKMIVE